MRRRSLVLPSKKLALLSGKVHPFQSIIPYRRWGRDRHRGTFAALDSRIQRHGQNKLCEKVATDVVRIVERKKTVLFMPCFWKGIMLIPHDVLRFLLKHASLWEKVLNN